MAWHVESKPQLDLQFDYSGSVERELLLDGPVFDVRDAGRFKGTNLIELDLGAAEMVEQPRTLAEEDRHDVDLHRVDQACREILLSDFRSAGHRDVFPARGAPGLFGRGLDAVGYEGEGRAAVEFQRLTGVMGEDEYGPVEWRIVSPPAPPGILAPGPGTAAEHVPAHDGRAEVGESFLDHGRAGVDLASVKAMRFSPGGQREG